MSNEFNEDQQKCGFFAAYIRSKRNAIILSGIFIIILSGIFFLYNVNLDAIVFASIICTITVAIYIILDFPKFHQHLNALKHATSNITLTLGSLPSSENDTYKAYENLVRILYESRSELITENIASKRYMEDYYAMWVHQIKVPISAMHMLLHDQPKSSPLNIQLFKIEQYVEMALSYVRLESDSSDYVIKRYDLDSIVKSAVRKYAPLFISKKISLDIADTNIKVNTDEKWLSFVIEQILSNSLKYTPAGKISIFYEAPKTLIIRDTGIGIAPEEIPRIGEKGFTGYNGRTSQKSTGLGLYLCNEILSRLSHAITIQSEVGVGTTVSIDLQTRDMILE